MAQVNQKIADAEHGIVLVLAHGDGHDGAVLLHDNAMQRQRNGDPLIVLDAAVIMRVQIRQTAVLIQRILLYVHARRIDVRAQNVDALFHGRLADDEEHDALAHPVGIHLVAGLQRFSMGDFVFQIRVALRLGQLHDLGHAFALGLAVVKKRAIARAYLLQMGAFRVRIGFPCNFPFHFFCLRFHSACPHDTTGRPRLKQPSSKI